MSKTNIFFSVGYHRHRWLIVWSNATALSLVKGESWGWMERRTCRRERERTSVPAPTALIEEVKCRSGSPRLVHTAPNITSWVQCLPGFAKVFPLIQEPWVYREQVIGLSSKTIYRLQIAHIMTFIVDLGLDEFWPCNWGLSARKSNEMKKMSLLYRQCPLFHILVTWKCGA